MHHFLFMIALASVFLRREPSATGSLHKCANVAIAVLLLIIINLYLQRHKKKRKGKWRNGEMFNGQKQCQRAVV